MYTEHKVVKEVGNSCRKTLFGLGSQGHIICIIQLFDNIHLYENNVKRGLEWPIIIMKEDCSCIILSLSIYKSDTVLTGSYLHVKFFVSADIAPGLKDPSWF